MNKEQLLEELSIKLRTGEIKREEVLGRIGQGASLIGEIAPASLEVAHRSRFFSVTKILYIIGAAIVTLGIIFFIAQVWDEIGMFGRISVTFGLGLLLACCGSLLLVQKPESYLGDVFHFIAGLIVPSGALVALFEFTHNLDLLPVTMIFGVMFLCYTLLALIHKREVLTFFSIANGTTFIYLLIEHLVDGRFYQHTDIYTYITMVIGLSYLLLAYTFRGGWNGRLVGILNFFGSIGFFAAAFSRVFDSLSWQALFFVFVIVGMVASIPLKSRNILAVSTLFLVAHFIYITGEYFANSVGWPISLIALGFLIIGLGYVSINIGKKYIVA